MQKWVLVTGCAGFIGYHVTRRLLDLGHQVVGVDQMNAYYEVSLKEGRLALLERLEGFRFARADLEDQAEMERIFSEYNPYRVIHLAAQAGVRYSLEQPHAYTQSNITGFLNVLEGCRHLKVGHLIYASSSSVYGANAKVPFHEDDGVDHPVSLYAATKKANELMAHTYSHLYGIPVTGLRFFTVYGPWGRPDMAYFLFTEAILKGQPIKVYNQGEMSRDFTYVDDVVEGIVRLLDRQPAGEPAWDATDPRPSTSYAPYRVYNIGNQEPVALLRMIKILEELLGKKAEKIMLPMQPGDVKSTFADVSALMREVGYQPSTRLEDGLASFVSWYKDYYEIVD